jgi:hypothetical protein
MTVDEFTLPRSSMTFAQDSYADELRCELVQLRCKLTTLPVIEQAKGMLMGAFGLSCDHAFELLKSMSQSHNVKVREVARCVVERWLSDGPRPKYRQASEFLVSIGRELGEPPSVQ